MAKGKKRAKESARRAGDAAASVRENPYIQRLVSDEELRETIRDAFEAARSAYERAASSKHPARSVVENKKVQRDLREASESLREAAETLRDPEPSSSTLGRLLLIAVVGAVLAIALSEDLRQAVLDKLFGAEEEFEYASTTAPAGASGNNGAAADEAATAADASA